MLEGISGAVIVAVIDFLMVFLVLGGLAVVIVGLQKFVQLLEKPAAETELKPGSVSPQSSQVNQIHAHIAAITAAMYGFTSRSPEAFRIEDVKKEDTLNTYRVIADEEVYEVRVKEGIGATLGDAPPRAASVSTPPPSPASPPAAVPESGGTSIQAPMPGKILAVHVDQNDTVTSGTVLIILEAMKMENDIMATIDGTVTSVKVKVGDTVNTGDVLVVLN